MTEALHPRDAFELQGAEAAEQAWLAAVGRGRLHHAWLLTGPEGLGKASFAYRAARRLLGARPDPSRGLLGAAPQDPVSRLVSSRSHPDLLVLEKAGEDGKPRRNIPVEETRRLPEFFSKAPGMAEWRVAIIDAADDLNANSANAVLKTLEEPPERGVVLLVAHAPGRLLPTIRSRCRRLAFAPWPLEEVAHFLRLRTNLAADEAARLAELSGGAPGRALALAEQGALEMDAAARELVRSLPDLDKGALMALTDRFRGGEGAARFALLTSLLAEHVRAAATVAAERGGPAADRIAAGWERLSGLPGEVEALNLDRADALWTATAELRRAFA
ncbi:MAG TPA: DNA polymerase III subunit delta' [Caulobacteraceae bacterium]|jgi:DNA polymerase-3 subunit delta'